MSNRKYTIEDVQPKVEPFLKRILESAGISAHFAFTSQETPHPDFENPDVRVKFSGKDVDDLLANKAEVLLALEHLSLEILHVPQEDHTKVTFDANDHRMLRIEELRFSAKTAAERVRTSKMPFRFNPMNSRERRVLHMALRGDETVRSESEGFEPRRNVVIYPAGMPSSPQPQQAGPPMRRSSGRDGGREGRRR